MNENYERCKHTADKVTDIAQGKWYKCPECDEIFEWDDETECPNCESVFDESEMIPFSLYDYILDNCDVELRIDGRTKAFKSCKVCVAYGGPSIYIDTGDRKVKLYWWNEYAEAYLDHEVCDDIDEIIERYYYE